ncbi:MAG: rod shape-determining protein RodA [Flavobacteriales bacterium]
MDRRTSITKYLDWPTFLLYLALVIVGWFNIHSAAFDPENPNIFSFGEEYGKQFIWIVSGLFLGGVILLLEGDFFRKFASPIYGISILLLILVLFFGKEVHGARSWFGYGSIGIQPAEFAKPALGLAMAQYLSSLGPRSKGFLWNRSIPLLIMGLPMGLILLQPDTGTALIFLSFFIVLYREGWSGNLLIGGFLLILLTILTLLTKDMGYSLPFMDGRIKGSYILIGAVLLIGALIHLMIQRFIRQRLRRRSNLVLIGILILASGYIYGVDRSFETVLDEHQQKRIKVLLGSIEDPQGAGYNVEQAKTAIGSGGVWGKGFKEGPLTKYKYVPMQSTDFIFCTIGEEWGFMGSMIVVLLFMILIIRLILLAERQRSSFSRIYGYSVASILFIHVAINIGMAIGLAPVIGIPLPFFSYGGSSFWAFTILIFILLRLDGERLMVLR